MYDRNKVNFSEVEHVRAASADRVYELVRANIEDGLSLGDVLIIPGVVAEVRKLVGELFQGTREEVANKFLALGLAFYRDNA